ncbi:MAG: response regulator transcription factor [Bacteroidota bacterium]
MPIRLAIADDHQLFVEGMRLLLARYSDLELIIEAANGQELMRAISIQQPDLILLDLKMPEMDGLQVLRQIKQDYPQVRIIVLSLHDNERLVAHLMEEGANAYLLKNEKPATLYQAIRSVYETGYFFSDYVGKALLKNRNNRIAAKARLNDIQAPSFSRRELEVLQLICQQHTTAEIAKLLFITPRTVEGHRKNLLAKSDTKNVAGLVVYAMRNGLVEFEE